MEATGSPSCELFRVVHIATGEETSVFGVAPCSDMDGQPVGAEFLVWYVPAEESDREPGWELIDCQEFRPITDAIRPY